MAEEISTEDALDLLAPSEDALTTEQAIAATKNPDDEGPDLSEIEMTEKRMEKLRIRERNLLRLTARSCPVEQPHSPFHFSHWFALRVGDPWKNLQVAGSCRRVWISDATLSMVLGLLATVILSLDGLAFCCRSCTSPRNVFLSEVNLRLRGRPFESLHGFEAINDVTRMAVTRVHLFCSS